jgi:hypothetical protein
MLPFSISTNQLNHVLAGAKYEGPLAVFEWLVEMEAMPSIVTCGLQLMITH